MTDSEPRPTKDGGCDVPDSDGAGQRHDRAQEHAADRFVAEQDPEDAERVAVHHEEMRKIGAEVKGEGEIE